jgi:hypothetical protein
LVDGIHVIKNPKPWTFYAADNGHVVYDGPIPLRVHEQRLRAMATYDEDYDDNYGYWNEYEAGAEEVAGIQYDEMGNVVDVDKGPLTYVK